MSDVRHTFADLENGIDAETVGVRVTIVEGGPGSSGGVQSVVAGTNVTVDNTDPANPIVSATGGGGGAGTVTSVEGIAPDISGNVDLNLGTAAAAAASDFATAAQGAKADTAVQPGSLSTVATTGAYTDLSGKPTLGTAAALDVPATGDAANAQVVKGTDTRLTNARTPTTHTHAEGDVTGLTADLAAKVPTTRTVNGKALSADVTLTNTDVGAAATSHTHAAADVTSGTIATARLGTGTPAAGKYVDGGTGAWTVLPSSGGGATNLDALTDVDTTTNAPVPGSRLYYNGTAWVPTGAVTPTIAASTSTYLNLGTAVSITLPTGIQTGDLVVALIGAGAAVTSQVTSGWGIVSRETGSSIAGAVAVTAGSAALSGATATFNLGASTNAEVFVAVVRGFSLGLFGSGALTTTSTQTSIPVGTYGQPGALLLAAAYFKSGSGTVSFGSPLSMVAQRATDGNASAALYSATVGTAPIVATASTTTAATSAVATWVTVA